MLPQWVYNVEISFFEVLPKSTVTSWVRTKINFALIKLVLICLCVSHTIKSSAMAINDIDMQENLTKNHKKY